MKVIAVCAYCGAELIDRGVAHPDRREIAAWIRESAPERCPNCGARLHGAAEWPKISIEFSPRLVRRLA
jgi:DNA-directed RNA polymerase subunit RPC12/RpoP